MSERELGEAADRALYRPPEPSRAAPVAVVAGLLDRETLAEGVLLGAVIALAYIFGQVLARAITS